MSAQTPSPDQDKVVAPASEQTPEPKPSSPEKKQPVPEELPVSITIDVAQITPSRGSAVPLELLDDKLQASLAPRSPKDVQPPPPVPAVKDNTSNAPLKPSDMPPPPFAPAAIPNAPDAKLQGIGASPSPKIASPPELPEATPVQASPKEQPAPPHNMEDAAPNDPRSSSLQIPQQEASQVPSAAPSSHPENPIPAAVKSADDPNRSTLERQKQQAMLAAQGNLQPMPSTARVVEPPSTIVAGPSAQQKLPVLTQIPGVEGEELDAHRRLPMFVAPTHDELAQVRQVIQLLHRAYQAFEFYPLNHPTVQQFSQQLFDHLKSFFRFREMLELRLDRFQVIYSGQVVFEDENINSNFVYLLFSDGIRKLIFDVGLTLEEYMRFFHVMHRSSMQRSSFEDTITLLWEQQFKNIRYFLVEDLTEMYVPDLQSLYNDMKKRDGGRSQNTKPSGTEKAVVIAQSLARTRLQPSEEEYGLLQRMTYDEERGLMRRFLEIITRIMEFEHDVLDLERLVRVLSQLQPILLSVGEIEHLALCLTYTTRLSQIFAQRGTQQSQQWHTTLQNILRESYSEQVINKLTTLLNNNPNNEKVQQDIASYITHVNPPSADSLLKAFLWADSFTARQFLVKMLADKYKEQPRQLANGVISPEATVVRHTCLILGEIGNPMGRPLLQRAAKHEDPDVRADATRALLQCGDGGGKAAPQMVSLLRKNLGDENPDVRRSALKGLGQLGQRCLPLLRGLYQNRIYEQWPEEDQVLLFTTTVQVGQRFSESLEYLVDALCKQYSGWLAARKDPTTARLAVQCLQRNGSPRAIAAIEKLYQLGSAPIRNVCESMMQQIS